MINAKYSIMLSLMLMVAGVAFAAVPAFAGGGPGTRPPSGFPSTTTPPSGTSGDVTQIEISGGQITQGSSCVGSAQITGAGVVYFNAGETKTLTYTLTWTGLPNDDVFSVGTTAAPAGWTFNLLTTSVNVGSNGASGSAPLDVQVTAPMVVDTATMTISASDGWCDPTISASLTSSFASVPEFAIPAVLVASIAMLGVAFTRRSIITK